MIISIDNSEASITRRLQSQLDVDIKELLLSSRLLRTYSDEWIGWLFKNETDLTAYLSRYNITDKFERLYRTQTNSINQLLLSDAHSYIYAIVPGTHSKHVIILIWSHNVFNRIIHVLVPWIHVRRSSRVEIVGFGCACH